MIAFCWSWPLRCFVRTLHNIAENLLSTSIWSSKVADAFSFQQIRFFQILTLENQLVEFELEKNKFARSHDLSAEHTKQLEENRKMIADEFVVLKKKAIKQEKELAEQVTSVVWLVKLLFHESNDSWLEWMAFRNLLRKIACRVYSTTFGCALLRCECTKIIQRFWSLGLVVSYNRFHPNPTARRLMRYKNQFSPQQVNPYSGIFPVFTSCSNVACRTATKVNATQL